MRVLHHLVAGEECTINVPEHDNDIEQFYAFLARGDRYLAFDTESTGLDIFSARHQLRLVQFGNSTEAWVLRVDKFRDACVYALTQPRTLSAHNAPFDALTVERHLGIPLEELLPRIWDTKIMAHLLDPRGREEGGIGLDLKSLCAVHVDPGAPDTQNDLTKVFNSFGWTKSTGWSRIAIDHLTYNLYAGLDVILDHRLLMRLMPAVVQNLELSKFEHRLQFVLTTCRRKGMLLDVDYIKNHLTVDLHNEYVEHCDIADELGVENVHSNEQIIAALLAMGEELTEQTPKGQFKVDRAVLEPLADMDRNFNRAGIREPNPVAEAVYRAKRAKKWLTAYAEAFLEWKDSNDRLHPVLNTLQARTARMCLPVSEKLVTRRGSLSVDEIIIGDETIDADGNWVKVTNIHRYTDQEIVEYRNPGARYVLRSTREHQWLQRSPRGRVFLGPITSARPAVRLAPPVYGSAFDVNLLSRTVGETFASVVGLLATDGRLHSTTKLGEGMSALIYQTERKFYTQIRQIIPEEWISYDRITNGSDHHEIGLKLRVVRPLLEAAGLIPEPGFTLKDHQGLAVWVTSLPINEVEAFFRAVYVADGSTAQGHKLISVKPYWLRYAIRLAAYRLGWAGTVTTQSPSEWGNGPRKSVSFRRAVLHLRDYVETLSVGDVWCVSTETGTFTAEGDEAGLGFYLTGNSVSDPPLQQLPSSDWRIRRSFIPDPGYVMISSDYASVEMRVLAALCGDYTMRKVISEGLDLHSFTAERVFGPGFSDQQRKIAKNIGFGKVYGGGAVGVARLTGADVGGVKEAMTAYDATFPGVKRYGQQLIAMAKRGIPEVITPVGRRLPLDTDRLYAATNYMVQSTARDLLAQAIIRLFDAGLGQYILIPIHDEILGQAPVDQAEQIVKEIGDVMETEFQGVRIESNAEILGAKGKAPHPFPGSSWGAGYKAPGILPPPPAIRGRKPKPGQWDQGGLF